MLQFQSANTRMVDGKRAIDECVALAAQRGPLSCDLAVIHAAVGHDLLELSSQVREHFPKTRVVGATCAGVVGREGVSETLKDVALMFISGPEFAVSHVDGIIGDNSFELAQALARDLKAQDADVSMIYLLAPGIDIANDRVIAGVESVFGPEVTIFGATSSDNMHGVRTEQVVDEMLFEHAAYAVGFSDPSLTVDTQATHGFFATGEPMVVTKACGNRIVELDGAPAWGVYAARMSLPETATPADTIPIGALAEALPRELAEEYGNAHILRVVTHRDADGALVYATDCAEGTRLWLTVRDEELIFTDMARMVSQMGERAQGRKPVAVFQADCLARGRRLFDRIVKEELVATMMHAFSDAGSVPPWLGMYGFGEYARLGGDNAYHNYTTALAALYRD